MISDMGLWSLAAYALLAIAGLAALLFWPCVFLAILDDCDRADAQEGGTHDANR